MARIGEVLDPRSQQHCFIVNDSTAFSLVKEILGGLPFESATARLLKLKRGRPAYKIQLLGT